MLSSRAAEEMLLRARFILVTAAGFRPLDLSPVLSEVGLSFGRSVLSTHLASGFGLLAGWRWLAFAVSVAPSATPPRSLAGLGTLLPNASYWRVAGAATRCLPLLPERAVLLMAFVTPAVVVGRSVGCPRLLFLGLILRRVLRLRRSSLACRSCRLSGDSGQAACVMGGSGSASLGPPPLSLFKQLKWVVCPNRAAGPVWNLPL